MLLRPSTNGIFFLWELMTCLYIFTLLIHKWTNHLGHHERRQKKTHEKPILSASEMIKIVSGLDLLLQKGGICEGTVLSQATSDVADCGRWHTKSRLGSIQVNQNSDTICLFQICWGLSFSKTENDRFCCFLLEKARRSCNPCFSGAPRSTNHPSDFGLTHHLATFPYIKTASSKGSLGYTTLSSWCWISSSSPQRDDLAQWSSPFRIKFSGSPIFTSK